MPGFSVSQSSLTAILLAVACGVAMHEHAARGDVLVLSNGSRSPQSFTLLPTAGEPQSAELAPAETRSFAVGGRSAIRFGPADARLRETLDANSAYRFHEPEGKLRLEKLNLGGLAGEFDGNPTKKLPPLGVIPIKVFVDETDPPLRAAWEERLRLRVKAASFALERHALVRMEITEFATWSPDPSLDFDSSLREFEGKADPKPAAVAVGFSRRHEKTPGSVHLGGTRGPLHSHVLIREWAGETRESDRVEVLVHEMGHYLGAVHWPSKETIMRPLLAQPKSKGATFAVAIDPVNALAMSLVGEEIRRTGARHIVQVLPSTRRRLAEIYGEVTRVYPADPGPKRSAEILLSINARLEAWQKEKAGPAPVPTPVPTPVP